jgi:hypothetical protein
MGTAFPPADYYGGSVALGLAPRRRSRVPYVWDVDRVASGAQSVSLRSPYRDPVPSECLAEPGSTGSAFREHRGDSRRARPDTSTEWTLGFSQYGLRHTTQVSTGLPFDGFQASDLHEHAMVPSGFRPWVSSSTYGQCIRPISDRPRILTCRDATHRPNSDTGGEFESGSQSWSLGEMGSLAKEYPVFLDASAEFATSRLCR